MKYIDVEELLKAKYIKDGSKIIGERTFITFKDIEQISYADVEPIKHGRWKDSLYKKICSECNFGISKQFVSWCYYCPRCGAKMDKI